MLLIIMRDVARARRYLARIVARATTLNSERRGSLPWVCQILNFENRIITKGDMAENVNQVRSWILQLLPDDHISIKGSDWIRTGLCPPVGWILGKYQPYPVRPFDGNMIMSVYDEATPYVGAIGALLFNGNGWANAKIIQCHPVAHYVI